jgi:hypothetical protein
LYFCTSNASKLETSSGGEPAGQSSLILTLNVMMIVFCASGTVVLSVNAICDKAVT